jgi:hypothetical protein
MWMTVGSTYEIEREWIYIEYRLDEPGQASAFIRYTSSESVILPDARYPVMRLLVIRNTKVARAPSRYSAKPGADLGVLSTTETFSLLLSDGEGEERAGTYFHYPEKMRVPEPEGFMKEAMDGRGETAQMMLDIWNEKYGIGDEIEEGRRAMLVSLAQDALREGDRGWIADAIDSGSNLRRTRGDGWRNSFLLGLAIAAAMGLWTCVEMWWKRRRVHLSGDESDS